MEKTFNEKVGMKGEWDFYITPDGIPLTLAELALIRAGQAIGRAFRHVHYSNIIPTVSRQQIAKAITSNLTTLTEIEITHQELGTGTTAPANGDTGLQTPSAGTRKSISSMAYSANVMNFTSFWAATEATGTWREFCLFINGTGTSNSGTVFNRVAINITVGSSDALTIDGTVTIS
jgi:hypothetical protein